MYVHYDSDVCKWCVTANAVELQFAFRGDVDITETSLGVDANYGDF